MPQLKPSFIAQVQAALEKSHFTQEDFKLDFPESGQTLARIIFAYKPEYFLILSENTKREQVKIEERFGMTTRSHTVEETVVSVTIVPGKFKALDNVELPDVGKLIDKIPDWCNNIRDELYAAAPKQDPLTSLREQLQKSLESLVDEPEKYFDATELSNVDQRFDELLEEIAKLKDEYSLTKQQLDSIQKDVAEFKRSARAYPKGLWAKVVGNKLVKTAGQMVNSPEGRALIAQEIKRALGL